jgi:hypothetical protein
LVLLLVFPSVPGFRSLAESGLPVLVPVFGSSAFACPVGTSEVDPVEVDPELIAPSVGVVVGPGFGAQAASTASARSRRLERVFIMRPKD